MSACTGCHIRNCDLQRKDREIEALQKELSTLRSAVAPLADLFESIPGTFMGYEDGHHDDEPVNGFQPNIKVGHVRAAVKALGRKGT